MVAAGVRRADAADVDAACVVLADAFADYPWTRWTVDAERHGERIEALQRLCMERVTLPYGEVWVACDAGDDIVSVAMWMLPSSVVPESVAVETEARQATLEGTRHRASAAAEALVGALRPTVPHYYLGTVGTRRNRQGRGHGTSVLRPILDRAEHDGDPVFLETSDPRNCELYTRLGFVTVAEIAIADGAGPHVWAMLNNHD